MLRRLLSALSALIALTACDPLAPDPTIAALQRAALQPTVTPIPPTAVPSLTPTITPTPTATPTPTPTFPPTPTSYLCLEARGQTVELSFFSQIARQDLAYRVYLPPCYAETQRRYPFVVLLHGQGGDQSDWTAIGAQRAYESALRAGAVPPMLLIMPSGGALADENSFAEGRSWASVVLQELLPNVERNFCTWNAREGRAIGGFSRGGFWALHIAFRYPEFFGTVGAHSPALYEDNAPPNANPLDLARTAAFPPGAQPRLWIDIGLQDDREATVTRFVNTLVERGIAISFTRYSVGEHDIAYWTEHAAEYLIFYGQLWPRDVRDLPTCLE
ncbi:MAG: alpha/beta hydrolase-fold protein [Aggregatilineales bacterium]